MIGIYSLEWLTKEDKTVLHFHGQEIPGIKYKSHNEKAKNKKIKNRINELLNTNGVYSIYFWKHPKKHNSITRISNILGQIERDNWESLL